MDLEDNTKLILPMLGFFLLLNVIYQSSDGYVKIPVVFFFAENVNAQETHALRYGKGKHPEGTDIPFNSPWAESVGYSTIWSNQPCRLAFDGWDILMAN